MDSTNNNYSSSDYFILYMISLMKVPHPVREYNLQVHDDSNLVKLLTSLAECLVLQRSHWRALYHALSTGTRWCFFPQFSQRIMLAASCIFSWSFVNRSANSFCKTKLQQNVILYTALIWSAKQSLQPCWRVFVLL